VDQNGLLANGMVPGKRWCRAWVAQWTSFQARARDRRDDAYAKGKPKIMKKCTLRLHRK
jgi:hypothetical protein